MTIDLTGIPMITLLSVLLATVIPKQLEPLVSSGEGIAAILLSFFFAAVGRNSLKPPMHKPIE